MPKVFIPNVSGQDISSAANFGDVVVMSEGPQRKNSINEHFVQFTPFIETSTVDDKVAIVGPNTMLAIAASMFAYKHGRVNFLIFSGGEYRSRTLVLNRKQEIEDGQEGESQDCKGSNSDTEASG